MCACHVMGNLQFCLIKYFVSWRDVTLNVDEDVSKTLAANFREERMLYSVIRQYASLLSVNLSERH